jgi:hypothetical protein
LMIILPLTCFIPNCLSAYVAWKIIHVSASPWEQ